MKKSFHLVLIAVMLYVIPSCTIEKRKYMPGYNVQWKSSNPERKRGESVRSSKSGKGDTLRSASQSDFSQTKDVTETAGLNYSLSVTKHATKGSDFNAIDLSEECDEVILKSGKVLKVKVTEISKEEIKYKKCGDIDEKTYSLKKTDVFMIRYPNGTKDLMNPATHAVRTEKKTNQKTDSGIFGILSFASILAGALVLSFAVIASSELGLVVYLVFATLAIVFGAIGIGKERKNRGFAITGLILGIAAFLLLIAALLVYPIE